MNLNFAFETVSASTIDMNASWYDSKACIGKLISPVSSMGTLGKSSLKKSFSTVFSYPGCRSRPLPSKNLRSRSWVSNGDLLVWMPPASVPLLARNLTTRSEEHTSELQSRLHLLCPLLLDN